MTSLVATLNQINQPLTETRTLTIDHLAVYQGERIGIIGDNGQGKTTLLRIVAQQLIPQRGTVQNFQTWGYLSQRPSLKTRHRFSDDAQSTLTLSGGEQQRRRIELLLANGDSGLLLDEPTTYLDQAGIRELTDDLRYYYGTLLIVSHDRTFLDQIVTKLWVIADGQVRVFNGNYQAYQAQLDTERVTMKRQAEVTHREQRRLQQAITQQKQRAGQADRVSGKQRQRHIKPDRYSATKQKDSVAKAAAKRANAMEKRLERLAVNVEPSRQLTVTFPVPTYLELHNDYPIRGERVTIERAGKLLLNNVNFQFARNQVIAITGPNGSGKTSLFDDIITGGPGIVVSPKAKIAIYQQFSNQSADSTPLLTALMRQTDYPEKVVRRILAQLRFKQAAVQQPLNTLSGGEATRFALARLFVQPANILLLDEPTNFMDIATIESLEQLLKAYPGTVLVTSHDQSFLNHVADAVYAISKQQLKRIR
ncbi:ribosomal protection-like ABC-F family protein [Secundilactobacillus muriivasis]